MRHTELITNAEYIPRVLELESQGAVYWTVKVLHGGYEISYDIQSVCEQLEMRPIH